MGYGIDASRAHEHEAKLMAAHAASAARERALQQELARSQAAAMGYGIDYEKAHDHERHLLAEAAAGAAKARALQRDLADARGHLIGTSIDFEKSHEHEKQAIAEAAAQAARAREYRRELASARALAMGHGIDASRAHDHESKLMAAHAASAARERALQQELAQAKAAAMGYGIDYEKAHDHERQLLASDAAKAARVRSLERELADARGHLIGTSIDFEKSHEHEKQAIAEAAAQAARARQYKHDLESARASAMGYGIDASRAHEHEAKLMAAHAAAAARERSLQQELARTKAAAMGYGIDYEKSHQHEAQLVAHAAADAARIRRLEQELKQSNARAMGLGIDYHRAHKNGHGLLAEAAAAKSRARAAARRYVEGIWHSLCLELERGSWPHVTLVRGKVNDAMQTLMTDASFVSQLGRQFRELAGADEMVRRDDDSLRAMVTDLRKFFLRRIFHDDPSLQTALADRASDPSRARRMLRQSLDALAKARPADLDAIVQALMEDCGALDDDVVTFEEFCRIAGALFLAAVRPDICPSDLVAVSRANFARARRAGGLLAPGYVEAVAEWLSEDLTRDFWASMKTSGEGKEAAHRFFLRVPDLREFLAAFDQHDASDDSGSLVASEVPQLLASNLQVFAQRLRDDTRGNCTRLAFTIADDVPAEVVAQEPIKAGAASVAAASGSGKGGAGGAADGVAGDGRRLAAAAREMRSRADLFLSASSKSKTDLIGMVMQDVEGTKSKVSRSEFVRLTLVLALAVARHDLLSSDSAARKVLGERGDFLTAGDAAAAGGAADKRG